MCELGRRGGCLGLVDSSMVSIGFVGGSVGVFRVVRKVGGHGTRRVCMQAGDGTPWKAYNARSGAVVGSIRELIRSPEVQKADAILVGETHDDPVAHVLEKQLLEEVINLEDRTPMLSMEILESDVQLIVDEFISDAIRESDFKSNARLPFNYDKDYKPLVDLAKEKAIAVIAPNAPRRYVSLSRRVGREGLKEAISETAQSYLPPLPYADASDLYKKKFARTMMMMRGDAPAPGGEIPEPPAGMMDAQSLWDASMAYSICTSISRHKATESSKRPLLVHIGGIFHVEYGMGIPEHLPKYDGSVKTITVVFQPGSPDEDFNKDRYKDIADFCIITDEKLPRSY